MKKITKYELEKKYHKEIEEYILKNDLEPISKKDLKNNKKIQKNIKKLIKSLIKGDIDNFINTDEMYEIFAFNIPEINL